MKIKLKTRFETTFSKFWKLPKCLIVVKKNSTQSRSVFYEIRFICILLLVDSEKTKRKREFYRFKELKLAHAPFLEKNRLK